MKPHPNDLIPPEHVTQVLEVTDTFSIDRDVVVVPLKGQVERGSVLVLPDGKVLIHPPPGPGFAAWLEGLPADLARADLRKTRRA